MFSTKSYVLLSTLAAGMAVWHAFATRQQFYASMVHLTTSKVSMAALGNLGFAVALICYKCLTMIFLGRLRDAEIERINDKISQAIIETLLAMTIFRQDFTLSFFSMFAILSFVKIFHWLVQDRVDFIETTPNVTRLQHARILAFTLVLMAIDTAFLRHTINKTLVAGVSIHLLFAFEYAIQATTILTTLMKYLLSLMDMNMEGGWEHKGLAVFYLDLTLDLLHLIVYSVFFAVVFSTYGIPIHLVRELYWTFRNFQIRVRDFLRYRRITANMEQRFPDATPEDLERAGHVCIVCREEMAATGRCKRLGCNHVFHLHCLRSWLERQQNCPICRAAVVPQPEPVAAAAAVDAEEAERMAQFLQQAWDQPGMAPAPPMDQLANVVRAARARAAAGADAAQPRRRRRQQEDGQGQGGAAPGMDPQHVHQHQWMPAPPMGMYVQGGVQYAAQQQAPVGAVPYHPFVPGQGIVPIPVHVPPPPLGATQAQQGTPEQQQTAAALALMGAASAAASAVGGPGVAGQLPMPQDHAALAAFLAAAQNLKGVLEGQLSSLQGYLDQLAQQQQQARQPSDNSTATPQPQPPLPAAEPVVASEGEAPIRPPLEEGQEPSTGDAPSSGVVNGTEERPGSSASNSSRVDEADEVRKRRLQRFAGNDIGE